MMQKRYLLIFVLAGLTSLQLQASKTAKVVLPAPSYLSNPYFLTCKSKCPVVDHGTWQELNKDCIYACMWFYESKEAVGDALSHAWTWLDEHIW